MHHTAKASINLAAIKHNLSVVRTLAPHSKIMAVIKADAYGHGIIKVAKTLVAADGIAVARFEEALEIRQAGINARLLLLGSHLDAQTLISCSDQSIDVVLHTNEGVHTLLNTEIPNKMTIWLKLNTGMHRLGLDAQSFVQAHQQLRVCPSVAQIIHMSHFSDSEVQINQSVQQLAFFEKVTASLDAPASLANSAAIIQQADSHKDWIRPGIILYGVNPLSEQNTSTKLQLKQAMTLSAKIIAINAVPADTGVGYNSTWRSNKKSVIATVGIGYGDGYPRHAKNGTPVLVNRQRASLAGSVSMDLITVDVTHCDNVKIGDDVILWGDKLRAETIAPYCDTIAYELFTSISKRVPRIYTD